MKSRKLRRNAIVFVLHLAECKNINYDPLVMSDGIAPTDDPVLLFRSPSYAVSFVKRLQGQ